MLALGAPRRAAGGAVARVPVCYSFRDAGQSQWYELEIERAVELPGN